MALKNKHLDLSNPIRRGIVPIDVVFGFNSGTKEDDALSYFNMMAEGGVSRMQVKSTERTPEGAVIRTYRINKPAKIGSTFFFVQATFENGNLQFIRLKPVYKEEWTKYQSESTGYTLEDYNADAERMCRPWFIENFGHNFVTRSNGTWAAQAGGLCIESRKVDKAGKPDSFHFIIRYIQ